jgi:hypothetical protein
VDAGADAFLVKGCSTDLLLKTIGQVGQTKEKGNQSSSPKKLKFIKESVKNSSDRVHDHLLSMNWRPRLS